VTELSACNILLSSLCYLEPQKFSGRTGKATIAAIRAFQKANGLPETGSFTDSLSKKGYEVAGQEEPPQGHLFVRENFKAICDTPIAFHNPEQTLACTCLPRCLLPARRMHDG
jgi:peptidoglycan hydrolase-like protein with peptidoglycan-binding domain